MKKDVYHLTAKKGPDKGLKISVPSGGARAGRSSKNDIVFEDPAMSRFHCRFFFKPGDGLWAEDLGSENETLVNGKPLREQRIHIGDRIVMGDTTLEVASDVPATHLHERLFDKHAKENGSSDIEIMRPPQKTPPQPQRRIVLLLMLAGAAALAATFVWLWPIIRPDVMSHVEIADTPARPLEIHYEKIQASPDNIFRYEMELVDNKLSIQIDDLKNQRHVPKDQQKRVDPELIRNLIDYIEHSGFFEMKEEYKGRPSNVWDVMDLSITIGRRTHRVVVQNRIEPDDFKNIRETIEAFGRNELGLAALALSHEKLTELARNAWLQAQKLYDLRQVKHENLALAIRSLNEMEWYLETIEPKPDYYEAAIALLGESERELQEIHDHHLFLANRAIRLRDWAEAVKQLRIICEKIPDRSDERHKAARKKLIDVERRLKRN